MIYHLINHPTLIEPFLAYFVFLRKTVPEDKSRLSAIAGKSFTFPNAHCLETSDLPVTGPADMKAYNNKI